MTGLIITESIAVSLFLLGGFLSLRVARRAETAEEILGWHELGLIATGISGVIGCLGLLFIA